MSSYFVDALPELTTMGTNAFGHRQIYETELEGKIASRIYQQSGVMNYV